MVLVQVQQEGLDVVRDTREGALMEVLDVGAQDGITALE
jgi:hypothetical protein